MQIHELKRNNPNKKRKTVGRGGKRGKTSGRGTKGQNARSGSSRRPEERDLIKKLPKLRGRGVNQNKDFGPKAHPVSLETIEANFESGERVNPEALFKKGLIKKVNGKLSLVKILTKGTLTKKIDFKNCLISKTAKEIIEKAGGKIL